MPSGTDHFFVLTGGPGAGKTTVANALADAGFATTIEAGRGVIRSQELIGGTALPWSAPSAFAELMLGWETRSFEMAKREAGPVFFDRGVPDLTGYLRLSGLPVPAHITRACELFRYNSAVFVFPPWPEIYTRDEQRRQDLAEADRTYDAVAAAYWDCGYTLIEVPRLPVGERMRFIRARANI